MNRALIVYGGWEGHDPTGMAELFRKQLVSNGFDVVMSDTLDAFKDNDLTTFSVIIPIWTMGTITAEQLTPLLEAVRGGVGLAGVHGGMCDAFRAETEYQYMCGGQWVAHPGGDGVEYDVYMDGEPHLITEGLPTIHVKSEQYYMHVDPANKVLATTRFGSTVMPVTWIKHYGQGRVFYCSLGHQVQVIAEPNTLTMVTRGVLWAARCLESGKP
ncbi:MAG: ThuA domain-containing protein [Aggregatilineales bacterium]